MRRLLILQHTEAEYLGLMEDHLEARRIAFQYLRPFVDQAWLLKAFDAYDGLVLLGGGPWGSAGERNLPTLDEEVKVCQKYLDDGVPVIGFGLGAQILARAAGGSSISLPFEFELLSTRRTPTASVDDLLPEEFITVRYGRDWAQPPSDAKILARDEKGRVVVFQVGENSFGFAANPGVKSGMIEDLIMEFEDGPDNVIDGLNQLRNAHPRIEKCLEHIMVGLMRRTGWMKTRSDES